MKFSGLARALPLALLGGALGSNRRALENKELRQLDRIMKGEVGKDELEIVLAQYDEDLSWSRPYDKVATVYCKGGDQCAPNSERLANVGREGHTFLHHIVKNYDNLAAWTVFSQAEEPTDGYRGQNQGGGHMLTGATFDDYLLHPQRSTAEDPEAFFLITSKVHLATLQHSLRSTFKTADGQQIAVASALPPMCPIHDASTGSTDTWRPYVQAPWLQTFVTDKCGLEPDIMGEALMSFWDAYLELPRPAANIAHYAQGARFAASRARIQQRSKLFYEKLLALVSTEQDPCMNYLYEWVWYYIIGKPESAACTVTEDEIQRTWAVEHRMLSGA